MGALAPRDEPHPGPHRRAAGDGARHPALPLLNLRPRPAAPRLLRLPARHGLGAGAHDHRRHPAPRHGRRDGRLARRLRAGADQRRLLSGGDPAGLAAARRLGAALGAYLRGDARADVPARLPLRPFPRGGGARPLLCRARRRRLPARLPQCAAARRAAPGRRVAAVKVSAGLLVYRLRDGPPEVLLVHPGGPFWARKDEGAWSIPKGEATDGVDLLATAYAEFHEETGSLLAGSP